MKLCLLAVHCILKLLSRDEMLRVNTETNIENASVYLPLNVSRGSHLVPFDKVIENK